jgi:hypothetical protein
MKNSFNFSYRYDKFSDKEFTTIRGSSAENDYKVGQIVDIKVNRKTIGKVEILKIERKRIKDIPLELLKKDGEYPDHKIHNHQDFIDLINSFRRFHFVSSDLMFLTLFYLTWKV